MLFKTCLTISSMFAPLISILFSFSAAGAAFLSEASADGSSGQMVHLMHRLSDITQRLLLVKVLALVRPSPVLLAMVKVQ